MNYLVIFGKPRIFGLLSNLDQELKRDTNVVIESLRGLEIACLAGILTDEQVQKYRQRFEFLEENGEPDDGLQMKPVEPPLQDVAFVRIAQEEDICEAAKQRQEEDEALPLVRDMLKKHALPMKIVDMEYLWIVKSCTFILRPNTG